MEWDALRPSHWRRPRATRSGFLAALLALALVVLATGGWRVVSQDNGRSLNATALQNSKVLSAGWPAASSGSAPPDRTALAEVTPSTTTTLPRPIPVPPTLATTTTTTAESGEATTTLAPVEDPEGAVESTTTSTTTTTTTTTAPATTTGPDPRLAGSFRSSVPDWLVFPDEEWLRVSPSAAGIDGAAWKAYLRTIAPRVETTTDSHHQYPNQWGVAITRGGYLIYTAGDPETTFQSASVGKTFTRIALLIADRKGLIDSVDDLVSEYWVGDGSEGARLSSSRKHMNKGNNADVTFRDLAFHRGGFVVTNGGLYNGNAFADNYAVNAPRRHHYSSGGVWRLSQALTYLFDDELKDVLDRELFQHMGIDAADWDWTPGREVANDQDFYPVWNNGPNQYYGEFVDPPYAFNGHEVQGGGGWVRMSPEDLARVALLIATDGYWDGTQLISPVDTTGQRGLGNLRYLGNHSGGNGSRMEGFKGTYGASAWVRTKGISPPRWPQLVAGPPQR